MSEGHPGLVARIDETYRDEAAARDRDNYLMREALFAIMESAPSVPSSVIEVLATNALRAVGAIPECVRVSS